MKNTVYHIIILVSFLMASVTLIRYDVSGEELIKENEQDLITLEYSKPILHQYEGIGLIVKLNDSLKLEELTLVSNVQSWIRGIPPISEQLPYHNMKNNEIEIQRNGEYLTWNMSLNDQMIWFDGEKMLDNITVTLAFLCIFNGTEDLETAVFTLEDVNDPPLISGNITIEPSKAYAGQNVTMAVDSVMDPEMKDVELRWESEDIILGTGVDIISVFDSPGIYFITLIADDGHLSVERSFILEIFQEKKEEEGNSTEKEIPENEKKEDEVKGADLPWFLVPIIILLIVIVLIMGFIRSILSAEDLPEKKNRRRRLWSMSPLRGPSRYEKEVLNVRMEALTKGSPDLIDEESTLDEDFKLWEKDWDFEPGF
jgi:hypothetical protein